MEHAWRNAYLATALISSAPTLVLPFIPESATKAGSGVQRLLLCFAVGGMMGDVFLHLLPHLFAGECDNGHGFVGGCGIVSRYVIQSQVSLDLVAVCTKIDAS